MRSLTLVATTPGGPDATPSEIGDEFFALFDGYDAKGEADRRRAAAAFLVHSLPREWCAKPANVKLLQKAVDAFVAAPRSERGIRAQLAAVQRFSIAKHLHAVTCRALVLHGDVDAVVPVENALLLKSLLSNRRGHTRHLASSYPQPMISNAARHRERRLHNVETIHLIR